MESLVERVQTKLDRAVEKFNNAKIILNRVETLYSKIMRSLNTKQISSKDYIECLKKSKWYGPYTPSQTSANLEEIYFFSADSAGHNSYYVVLKMRLEKGSLRLCRRYLDTAIADDYYFTNS